MVQVVTNGIESDIYTNEKENTLIIETAAHGNQKAHKTEIALTREVKDYLKVLISK